MLHVTNGDSAAGTLRETALGGAVLPWNDTLHEGPVPDVERGALLQTRASFLAECGWGGAEALQASLDARDRQLHAALATGDPVVLWFEHDLYDQLQLLDVLALAHAEGGEPELIVVDSFPGRPSFTGLGELTAAELETLWPRRRPAGPAALAEAAGAWDAFRAPEPVKLLRQAERADGALPLLAAALERLLEELPAVLDGLSTTERRALQVIADGAHTPAAAFVASQRLEDAPFLGDTWFYRSLWALGQGVRRLVEDGDGQALPPPPPLADGREFVSLRVRLTEAGESILRGESDRVEVLGIDRWIGGTHVTSGNVWRWDATTRQVVR